MVRAEHIGDSPVSNNGRGLKPIPQKRNHGRQKDSPVSNNGRGLKRLPDKPTRADLGFAR